MCAHVNMVACQGVSKEDFEKMRKQGSFCQPLETPQTKRAVWKAGVTSQCDLASHVEIRVDYENEISVGCTRKPGQHVERG